VSPLLQVPVLSIAHFPIAEFQLPPLGHVGVGTNCPDEHALEETNLSLADRGHDAHELARRTAASKTTNATCCRIEGTTERFLT